ncbi:MAG TPA: NADH-quinone oxidoreductase subunit C [Puia sp.]|nr:NADH-quinone oxidoreductase subunit C [Puia sp.]
MLNEDLKLKLTGILPLIGFEEGGEWLNMIVPPEELKAFVLQLRSDPDLLMDYLFCLTCVDWKTHFTMVYHFSSTRYRHNIVVKAKIDRANPEIETVSDIWRTAEMLEREVYDLFGVKFLHHPDLRRLIMPDDWEGWPLRKDFEDPVNMVRL